jgi:hypothetical protein
MLELEAFNKLVHYLFQPLIRKFKRVNLQLEPLAPQS